MKYCEKCGNELLDEAVMCPKCKNMVSKISTKEDIKKASLGMNIAFLLILLGVGIIVGGVILAASGF